MPNRCNNTVSIQWPPAELDKIKAYTKKKRFFKSFYPRPKALDKELPKDNDLRSKEMDRLKKRYWAMDRYDWNNTNRWTKRDVAKIDLWVDISDNEIMLYFDTAWWPPLGAIAKLAELHDKLTISMQYSEWGMWFSWDIQRTNGEETHHEERDDSFFWEGIPCSICWYIYDWDRDEDRSDYEKKICRDCLAPNPEQTWGSLT